MDDRGRPVLEVGPGVQDRLGDARPDQLDRADRSAVAPRRAGIALHDVERGREIAAGSEPDPRQQLVVRARPGGGGALGRDRALAEPRADGDELLALLAGEATLEE